MFLLLDCFIFFVIVFLIPLFNYMYGSLVNQRQYSQVGCAFCFVNGGGGVGSNVGCRIIFEKIFGSGDSFFIVEGQRI